MIIYVHPETRHNNDQHSGTQLSSAAASWGCSILYNLAEQGFTNILLLERDVLASGSTGKSQAILRMHYSNEVTARLAWGSLDIFKNFES